MYLPGIKSIKEFSSRSNYTIEINGKEKAYKIFFAITAKNMILLSEYVSEAYIECK